MYTGITMMITYGAIAAGGPVVIAVGLSGMSIGTVITIAMIVTGGDDPIRPSLNDTVLGPRPQCGRRTVLTQPARSAVPLGLDLL